jgi:hypothetical protein|tara:strand:+ start:62 stop:562 length:501 start_codon:yes stop_codon:yes gene_type:complete
MSDFQVINGMIGQQAIDNNSATQMHDLLHCVRAQDRATTDYGEGEFIYLLGLAATAVGSVVRYSAVSGITKLAVANDKGPIACAMAATVAGEYGWYQIFGVGVGKVKASFADDANCYLTSTAGSLDDAVVAGDRVHNCIGGSAIDTPSTGLALLELNYPHTDDIAD